MVEESRVVPEAAISESILEFIRRELLRPGDTIDVHDDLLSGELLDSLGVLRLSTFVEQSFQIRVDPADFVVENFQNVEVLAQFVQRLTGGTNATGRSAD
jgi:acyl carrier protein